MLQDDAVFVDQLDGPGNENREWQACDQNHRVRFKGSLGRMR